MTFRKSDLVSFDYETHKIQPGLLAPPIVVASTAFRIGSSVIKSKLLTKEQSITHLHAALRDDSVLCGANIAYDMAVAAAEDPSLVELIFAKYDRDQIFDTSIAQMLDAIARGYVRRGPSGKNIIIDPRTGKQITDPATGSMRERFSLAITVDQCLGRKDAKGNDTYRTSYALLEHLPFDQWPEEARQYSIDDAVNSLEVAEYQVEHHLNLHDLPFQCRAAFAEHLAAVWGMRTDAIRVEKLTHELTTKYDAAVKEFTARGVFRPDGSKDTKVLKAMVTAAYGGNPPTTKGGAVSTARDVLTDSSDETLEAFGEVSRIEKLHDTYLPFVVQGTAKPININPNVLLANGRSSYEGLIQLLPRKGGIRDTFVARPGHVWCSVDYAALESSTLAQVCRLTVGSSKMGDAINAGQDIHSLFAAQMYGVTYEEVIDAIKVKKDKVWKDRRQMTKAADFGYPGFMGAFKFAQSKRKEGLKLCLAARTETVCSHTKITKWKGHDYPSPACKACVEQAEVLRRAFLEMWPEVKEYFAWIQLKLEESDVLTQFVSGRVRGGLDAPAAANTLFSGLAADGAKRALWAVAKECYVDRLSPLFGSRVVIFAHDEIICEIPESVAHDAAHRQAEVMIREMQKVCPDVAIRAEPALMRYWYKDAEPVYKNGILVPWEPEVLP